MQDKCRIWEKVFYKIGVERTGMTVCQVSDEVLYTGLNYMQELAGPEG